MTTQHIGPPDVQDDCCVKPDDGAETEEAARDEEVGGVEPHCAVLLQRLRNTGAQTPSLPIKDLGSSRGGEAAWSQVQQCSQTKTQSEATTGPSWWSLFTNS